MINLTHFLAVLKARNREFFRDRASWAWNLFFPLLLIVGLSLAFGDDNRSIYTVAVHGKGTINSTPSSENSSEFDAVGGDAFTFLKLHHIKFVEVPDIAEAIISVERHQFDLLLDVTTGSYWINDTSPAGYIVERLLLGIHSAQSATAFNRQLVTGKMVRYVDWVVPGVLGLNMMFSCLFGVGYVIVRYRKSGVLKRLKATPLRAFEFLAAQVVSRMLVVLVITSIVFIGTNWALDFTMNGQYFNLLIVLVVGAFCLISLGLVFAVHTSSEELAGGLLNTATWPMMMLSGVWFSLEGAHYLVQKLSSVLPLTHVVDAGRAIMLDGAGLSDIAGHLIYLLIFALVCLLVGARYFKWES